jgi:hypothetical protein
VSALLIAGAVAFFAMGGMGDNDNTPTVSPTAALPVAASVDTPTPIKTRVSPTNTLTPVPTGTSTPAPTPLICQDSVEPEFSERYAATALGCPRGEGVKGTKSDQRFAMQEFESGWMFWRRDKGRIIYVLFDNGRKWERFQDPYIDGQPVNIDCQPPEDRDRPERGFGMIWRDELGGCAEAVQSIGWGKGREGHVGAVVQEFDAGVMIMLNPDQDPELYLLSFSGTDPSSGHWTR